MDRKPSLHNNGNLLVMNHEYHDISSTSRLMSKVFDSSNFVSNTKNSSESEILELLWKLNPASVTETKYVEFVALCLKLKSILAANHRRSYDDFINRPPILRILDLLPCFKGSEVLRPNDPNSDSVEKIIDADKGLSTEICVHTMIIAYELLSRRLHLQANRSPIAYLRTSCELIADVQKLNGRAFNAYLRCFVIWFFEEKYSYEYKDVINFYLKSSADLMTPSSYKEIVSIIINAIVERLSAGASLITRIQIDAIIGKTLELVPLPLLVEVIDAAIISSRASRVRLCGVICMEALLVKIGGYLFRQLDEDLMVISSVPYAEELDIAVKQLVANVNDSHSIDEDLPTLIEPIYRDPLVTQTTQKGIAYLVNIGASVENEHGNGIKHDLKILIHNEIHHLTAKHDSADAVRHRALVAIQSLHPKMITKIAFQVVAMKCRDKAAKVRMLAFSILVDLGSKHADRILKIEELEKTIKYLLQIHPILSALQVLGGEQYIKNLGKQSDRLIGGFVRERNPYHL